MAEKAVVTGGAGFIGSHIVDALVEKGFDTHVVDNFAAGRHEERISPRATYHEVDIRDYDSLAPVMKGAKYVFHEAALPRVQFSIENPLETFSVNVQGTAAVLRAAHQGGVKRLIYAASSSAYGDQERLPLREDMPAQPKSPYGLQKYMGELMCRLWSEVYGLETVSLRYFNVYGLRFDPSGPYALVMGKFVLQRSQGKPLTIWGDGTHTRDYTNAKDIVRANLLAMETEKAGKGEVINIGGMRNISVNEIAAMIGGPVIHEPERLEPAHTLADTARAKELLLWQPQVKLEDGVAEMKASMGIN